MRLAKMAERREKIDENASKWRDVQRLLTRSGPYSHPDFEASPDTIDFLQETCRILVIGAGGLGCELLKDLALAGFGHLDVIDMDTIDVSNLNRQFLFRRSDVGKAKAVVAASFIEKRVPTTKVTAHFAKIQDFGADFYRQFHIIVCGLDAIVPRRWINGMLISLLRYDAVTNDVDPASIIPLVDGGTEGFKGNARLILPGMTACVDCTLDLYPPQVTYPLCTIAHTPRLPEHCIEYARILLWPQEGPFGADVTIDGDDPEHVNWIYSKALSRAKEYRISGVTYRLTQGVIKNIIPAVASTNAVIASICANEVFKIATSCCLPLNNYVMFNDTCGVYTHAFEVERKDDCLACSVRPQPLSFHETSTLQDVVDYLTGNVAYQMKAPSLTTVVKGKNKTLYMQTVEHIEKATRSNLKATLKELELDDGQEIVVADSTNPKALIFVLNYVTDMKY